MTSDDREMFNAVWKRRQALGRKFEASDIAGDWLMRRAAIRYAVTYSGTNDFVSKIAREVSVSPSVTPNVAKALLNCLIFDAQQRMAAKQPAAPVQTTPAVERVAPAAIAAPAATGIPTIANATYTVALDANASDWQTFEVSECEFGNFTDGRRVLSLLTGQDNAGDYTGIGFLFANGSYAFWSSARKRGYDSERNRQALDVLLGSTSAQEAATEAYALMSSRCAKCHRKLTVPASIHRGFGPECAKTAAPEKVKPKRESTSERKARKARALGTVTLDDVKALETSTTANPVVAAQPTGIPAAVEGAAKTDTLRVLFPEDFDDNGNAIAGTYSAQRTA